MEEIGQEFKATASPSKNILPETVGGTKVHFLLGIKNTRIHPMLIRVLPSGVGVYLSPFKDVWGFRIIFAGPNKYSLEPTEINKESQTMWFILFTVESTWSTQLIVWKRGRLGLILNVR